MRNKCTDFEEDDDEDIVRSFTKLSHLSWQRLLRKLIFPLSSPLLHHRSRTQAKIDSPKHDETKANPTSPHPGSPPTLCYVHCDEEVTLLQLIAKAATGSHKFPRAFGRVWDSGGARGGVIRRQMSSREVETAPSERSSVSERMEAGWFQAAVWG